MQRLFRGVVLTLAVGFVITLTGCSGGATSPTAPSPATTPSPAPAPSPSPGPPSQAFGLSSVSLSASDVESQAQPQGTVTLTSLAPVGGVVVALSSTNPNVARVPTTVTVVAGASSATFAVLTSTVEATAGATIAASYAGVTREAALTVRPPTLTAAFTVRSPGRGVDACVLGREADEIDCDTDGTSSRGFLQRWHWRYWAGTSPLGHTTTEGLSKPRLTTGCRFLEGSRGGDNPDGSQYIQMTIELVVEDRTGARSAPVTRAVKLYPSRLCGFNY
jgi:hypothetical protein